MEAPHDPSQGLFSLVSLACAGDERAFSELVGRFEVMSLTYATGILRDRHLAEDAIQWAFLDAWRCLPQLREPERFPGWLRSIIFKHCDRLTRSTMQDEVSLHAGGEPVAADRTPADLPLLAALEALPVAEREVARMYYLGGRSLASLSAFLDLPVTTLKNRLHAARRRLKESLLVMIDQDLPEKPAASRLQETILRMLKPAVLDAPAQQETWDMFCAAIMGDDQLIARKLREDPTRARLEYWYTPPIHFAAREGHVEATRLLLEAHPRVDLNQLLTLAEDRGHVAVATLLRERIGAAADRPATAALLRALAQDDVAAVASVLTADPRLAAQPDRDGETPLHLAVRRGSQRMAALLLDAGAAVDAVSNQGFRPIHLALWKNQYWGLQDAPDLVSLLMARGARDSITLAAARGDEAAVLAFLERDPRSVNDGDTLEKRPLSSAIERGHRTIAELLLSRGADPRLPESRTCMHGFALMAASIRDDVETATRLLSAGADPNAEMDSSGTPAGRAGSDRMRCLLYEHGGKPLSIWVYIQFGQFETVAAILRYTPDPFAQEVGDWCSTPFTAIISGAERSVRHGGSDAVYWAMLRLFLAKGFRAPKVLTGCRSYLWHVPAMTKVLLEHGMDPDLPNWQRQTPLHALAGDELRHVSDAQRLELLRLFLDFGADLRRRDEEYRSTPLAWAARRGWKPAVELLLARGAPVELPEDEPWATPLAWARRRGHGEIVTLLATYRPVADR